MSFRALLVGVILIVSAAPVPGRAEGPGDAADLFPAQTLAYLEFRQPDKLAREVAALLRGSAFDDMPAVLAQYREKRGDNGMFFFEDYIVGYLGMFACPEVVAEFGRLQGGAVALTGFSKNMEPEIVGVLLSGTSNGPTFIMRTYLTVDGSVRKVDECEGIALYREKRMDFNAGKKDNTPPLPAQPRGPTYALLPDGFIIGSTTDSVKEMIRRLKGKTGDPALSSVAAFRDAATLRDKPGLFGYADLGALNIQLEEAIKNASAPVVLEWNRIKSLLNPKAGRQATLSFTLQNGSVELHARLSLDATETSPLLDLLPDKKASIDALHFVPKHAGSTVSVALSDGEKHWSKYLAVVEAMDKAEGKRGPTSSQQIAELETAVNLKFGKDVFGKLSEAVLVLDPLSLSAAHGNPLRLLVLTATDVDAAKAFEEDLVPKLATLIPPGQAKPTQETIQGQRISSLPLDMLGPGTRLHYGRHGKMLVFGLIGPETAAALASGAKKGGLLEETKTATALKETGDASVVGVMSLSSILPFFVPQESTPFRAIPGGAPPPPPKPGAVDPFKVKLTKELAKVTETLPPAILTIERKPDQVTLVLRQRNLKSASAKIINRIVDASLAKMLNPAAFGAVGTEIVPPPPKE